MFRSTSQLLLLSCLSIAAASCATKNEEKAPSATKAVETPSPATEALDKKDRDEAIAELCNAHITSKADGTTAERLEAIRAWAGQNINHKEVEALLVAGDSWHDLEKASSALQEASAEDCALTSYFKALSAGSLSAEQSEELLASVEMMASSADEWKNVAALAGQCSAIPGCAKECTVALYAMSQATSEAKAEPSFKKCIGLTETVEPLSIATHLRNRVIGLVEQKSDTLTPKGKKLLKAIVK
jgi:hypothetical protein